MEMELDDHLRLWSAAPRKLLTQSRYAALLVSMHGTALYEHRDVSRMTTADAAAVAAFLATQRALQGHLTGLLGADPEELSRNQRLLATWDALSLALCLRWSPYVAERACPRPREPRSTCAWTSSPWTRGRSRKSELTVRCEGRLLVGGHETGAELERALADAPHVPLSFRLNGHA